MSAPVDVLAVLRRHAESHRASAGSDAYSAQEAPRLQYAVSVVAELIEAVEAYAEAEAALANREIKGVNAESLDRLQPRVHAARSDVERALARVKGA